jgi:predicted ribosome quality control (RQC) complex YloA/Tae2 family protein
LEVGTESSTLNGKMNPSRIPPPPPDPDAGTYQGRSVARHFVSPDGLIILVGKTAADNDVLSLKLGAPRDFWLHIASGPGSHVVVRNPEKLERLPRPTLKMAAGLAVKHSKAKAGGQSAVHLTTCDQVGKPRGFEAGKVTIGRFTTVNALAADASPTQED